MVALGGRGGVVDGSNRGAVKDRNSTLFTGGRDSENVDLEVLGVGLIRLGTSDGLLCA